MHKFMDYRKTTQDDTAVYNQYKYKINKKIVMATAKVSDLFKPID